MYDRIVFAPRGSAGGGDGASGAVISQGERRLSPKGRSTIECGEPVTLLLPGGGGHGPASERVSTAVEADIADGYVSVGSAEEVYGKSSSAHRAS